jgi:hypothetical protein
MVALAAILLLLNLLISASQDVYCPITYQECPNGLFNPAKCACDCIPPFCPDSSGACLNPTGYCGGNPWASCERGVNCPWWVNPLKAETCMTGSEVPADVWDIYLNLEYCCMANYPYSTVCKSLMPPPTPPPTKAPVMASPASVSETRVPTSNVPVADVAFDEEAVPLKLTLLGVAFVEDTAEFKDAVLEEMKSILFEVGEDVDARFAGVSENYDIERVRPRLLEAQDFADEEFIILGEFQLMIAIEEGLVAQGV